MHLSSFLLLLVVAAVGGCDGAQDIDDVQQRLVGSWLRDEEEDGAHVRRVLVLQSGGRFAETSKATHIVANYTHWTRATGHYYGKITANSCLTGNCFGVRPFANPPAVNARCPGQSSAALPCR